MDWTHTTTRTIDLGYEQLLTFVGRPGTRVRVLYGSMWLTEEGREQDIFAGCGDEVLLKAGGLSVIEGLGVARVQVIEPRERPVLTSLVKRARSVWQRVRSRIGLRDVLARFVLLVLAIAVSAGVLHVAAPGPLTVPHTVVEGAARANKPVGAAASLLHDVASAGTGFLAVN
jgi:hypothetical protein